MTNKKNGRSKRSFGIRPLVIGKLKNSFILASETCALDIVGATFVREVENGEIVIMKIMSLKALNLILNKNQDLCV